MRGPTLRAVAALLLAPRCEVDLALAEASSSLSPATAPPTVDGGCPQEEERLDGAHCYGLEPDAGAAAGGAAACGAACCAEASCQAWQFHEDYGCFRGRPSVCVRGPSSFARGSVGARLRSAPSAAGDGTFSATRGGLAEMLWTGSRSDFSTFEAVEPYVRGAHVRRYTGVNGENYLLRRHGPEAHQLDVSVSCWSGTQQPSVCCGEGREWDCWGSPKVHERCCGLGVGETEDASYLVYDVFVMISPEFSPAQRLGWDRTFPGIRIDEAAFAAKRERWRFGRHEPGRICAASGITDGSAWFGMDSQTVLWPLAKLMLSAGVPLSRTFLNVGAGTCQPPDPLYQLAHSAEGQGFVGLAVDANASDLQRCAEAMRNASARVLPVRAAVDPLAAARLLRPPLAALFGEGQGGGGPPWPLDFMVVDIDGCDCLVAEELLALVRPKVLVVEMAFHYPPPFQFSAQHDAELSAEWLRGYDVHKFNPSTGCSLSYALRRFRPHGFHLLRLTHLDAVFVHQSLSPLVESALGARLPQDEFACYRQSHLWVQMPIEYVREWFFAEHPADSLGHIWANISQMNREVDRPLAPFVLDY